MDVLEAEGSEFIHKLATRVVGGRDGVGNGQERHLQGTSFTEGLSDLSGRYFTSSSRVQARITGPSSDEREEVRGPGADADGIGLSRRCRVGNYEIWKEEGKYRVGDFLPRVGKKMSLRIDCLGIL